MCLNWVGVLYLYFRNRERSVQVNLSDFQSLSCHCFVRIPVAIPWDVVSISYPSISRQCTVWSQLTFPTPLASIFLKNPPCQLRGTTSAPNRSLIPVPFADLLLALLIWPTWMQLLSQLQIASYLFFHYPFRAGSFWNIFMYNWRTALRYFQVCNIVIHQLCLLGCAHHWCGSPLSPCCVITKPLIRSLCCTFHPCDWLIP